MGIVCLFWTESAAARIPVFRAAIYRAWDEPARRCGQITQDHRRPALAGRSAHLFQTARRHKPELYEFLRQCVNELVDEYDLEAPELSNLRTPTQDRLDRFTAFKAEFAADLKAIRIQRQRQSQFTDRRSA